MKDIELPVPADLAEQRAIVTHLQATQTGLNGTISKSLSEISLLREYRTRLIADVVTGKLDVREAARGLPDADDTQPEELEDMAVDGGDDAEGTDPDDEESNSA